MNILTIIVIGVIALFALIGRKKGFIKMLFSLLSLVITIIVATYISPYISEYLQQTAMYDTVYDTTYEYIQQKANESMASSIDDVVQNLELPELLKESIIKKSQNTLESSGMGIITSIATQITVHVFDAVVFGVTFLAAYIIVKLISAAANIISYLPIIHGINKNIGFLIGAVEGLVIVWIFFTVITLMSNSSFATDIFKQINESSILTFIYNKNILMDLIF